MLNDDVHVGLEEANGIFVRGVLVGVLNEVVETLGLYQLLNETPVYPLFKLIQICIKVKYVSAC